MDAHNQLIIVNGKDKTDSISSYNFVSGKCNIIYNNSPRTYSYNRNNVKTLALQQEINPADIIFKVNGLPVSNIDQILDYGEFYRVVRAGKKSLSYRKTDVQLVKNCLANPRSKSIFEYFKITASAVSLVTDKGINILEHQYKKVSSVEDTTVLSRYLDPNLPIESRIKPQLLIYPFGLNQSQKTAVENAFSSQISIIQGPPGTGKTQTILNIIANAVRMGKTVAVVSNNNSATLNVAEKLEKYGVSFISAFLGNMQNKENFILSQSGLYPDMSTWILNKQEKQVLEANIKNLSDELNAMLASRNRLAEIEQELLSLQPEQFYFTEYYNNQPRVKIEAKEIALFHSEKLLALWLEYEHTHNQKLGFFKKLWIRFRFSKTAVTLFKHLPEDTVPLLQKLFYENKKKELLHEKDTLEKALQAYQFESKMQELSSLSIKLFKSDLSRRYQYNDSRPKFNKADFRTKPEEFNKEYPVILSTTYSIKGTLSPDHVYDFLIVDECSQVDLATGVLAFSCSKNIVIVGDQKQLPNVLTADDIRIADSIWEICSVDDQYRFSTHSMLTSAVEVWKDAPSVLLREHYRCHPKIAGFFNQKFYDGKLIVMTSNHGEEDVLSIYRTTPGNHARGHMNQRQIDVIKQEVLPTLEKQGHHDIGIITPYRDQVAAIKAQLGRKYEIATVHKFQGREKDAIILASVDNIIGDFVDNPNLLNVAVSRAVKSLSVIISSNKENEKTNYGDLEKYIRYNNFQVIESRVFSVFDLLYKGYYAQRKLFLQKHKKISDYDSENLAYAVIENILHSPEFDKIDCVMHSSLSTLVKDYSLLTEQETRYASNPLTHLDFLLFNRMDKKPVLVIEVDGTRYHAEGSRQAERDAMKNSILDKCNIPWIRIRTNESNEQQRITEKLKYALS